MPCSCVSPEIANEYAPMKNASELNAEFGIENELGFAEMDGEPITWIRNAGCAATIARKGAQVLSWYPTNQCEVFWVSTIRPGRDEPVRGGVPVCWPWFAAHPTDPSKPKHGFMRTRRWLVESTARRGQATELTLRAETTPEDLALWPYRAEVSLRFVAGATLRLELTTRNTGDESFELTQALHSYFRVSDIEQVEIEGFDGLEYLDKTDGFARKRQTGPISIRGEIDRIYLNHTGPAVIRDPALGRGIVITKSGSTSSVVWNPWKELAERLGDMIPEDYRQMLCVETTNAGEDIIRLAPGATHTLCAEIQVATG